MSSHKIRRGLLPGAIFIALAACAQSSSLGTPQTRSTRATGPRPDRADGRLAARPGLFRARADAPTGLRRVNVDPAREALLYVPPSYTPRTPAPIVVCLHGANAGAQNGLKRLLPYADEAGVILIAPKSYDRTWDAVLGSFGPDARFVDQLLEHVFTRYRVDPTRIAIQGFSDGASYALSLGLVNGDLFTHVIAFSAGFIAPGEPHGSPRIFTTHGRQDPVLPIDATSRRYVPRLEKAGYDVTYEEFAGGHRTPHALARAAVDWLSGRA